MMRIGSGFRAALLMVLMFGSVLGGEGRWPTSAHAARETRENMIEIDRVEVSGVTVFSTQEIEGAMEIAPGDRLERARVVRTAENLEALYRIHGYEQVSITSRLNRRKGRGDSIESALEFNIVEGKPTRIAEVRFTAPGLKGASVQSYWSDLKPELLKRSEIVSSEVLDQEKLTRARRAIHEYLASEEFVGARVLDVRIETVSTAPAGEATKLAAKWVAIDFIVELGDRVTFGFRGNQAFTVSRLSSLIGEQRVLGFGSDYVEAVRLKIEDEYRQAGFASVSIKPYTIERPDRNERHVTFAIDEGAKHAIASVAFDGNSAFSTQDLQGHFFERASALVQHGYYSERDVTRAAELTIEYMRSLGYLSAKLVTINALPVSKARARNYGPAFHLVIYLYEGEQTIVEGIRISGAETISPSEIAPMLGVEEGKPLNLFAFSEGIEILKRRYRSRGFLSMRIANESSESVVRYSDENRLAMIELEIEEGPQFRASRILIEGLTKTREEVVRREIAFKEGDVLEEGLVLQTEAALRRLGTFSVVTVRLTDDNEREGHKVVRITVQESVPGLVAGGVGFRNDLGVRLFGQTAYTNLMGRNHTIALSTAINRRLQEYRFVEYSAQLDYIWPWFALGDTTFRPALGVSATQFRTFDARSVSMFLSWEKRLLRRPELAATFVYSLERISQANAIVSIDNQDLTIGAVTPGVRLDTRDNPLAPTRGLYATASLEVASPYLGTQMNPFPIGYGKFQFRSDYFVPIFRSGTLYLSARFGFERSTQERTEDARAGAIPLIKQFALGGAGSIRGFLDQELNAGKTQIYGTLAYSNYRVQFDLPVAGALRFGPFLDAGNIFIDRPATGPLRYGSGFGFRYLTPVGPVNLDVGFKLFPRPFENPYEIYFSVGVI